MITTKRNDVPKSNLKRGEDQITQRNNFKFLGYTISSDGKDTHDDIKKRIATEKNKMKAVLKNKRYINEHSQRFFMALKAGHEIKKMGNK